MIVDASVAMKWFRPEADTVLADELLRRFDLIAPDSLDWELGHALTRLCRQHAITGDEARRIWLRLTSLPITRVRIGPHADKAFDLSLALNAGFYDCLYLAIAVALDDVLVTADQRFVNAAEVGGLAGWVIPLSRAAS